ncbi:hypothetical protein [Chlorogloeopsis sp. ULAP02]|uniref:hypothetical protein n=1 Tax=Chlorogloeopsis sp. ULAP02 TaxID=3107926 RepID=UPI00398AC4DC
MDWLQRNAALAYQPLFYGNLIGSEAEGQHQLVQDHWCTVCGYCKFTCLDPSEQGGRRSQRP